MRWVTCFLVVCVLGHRALAQPGATLASPPVEPHTHELFDRRPSDERLFLVPTPLAMRPGAVSLSDDELVSARLAVGVARHFQLDLRLGGLLIPGAIGGAIALPGGIAAGGGAGVAVLGLIDIGAKIPVLDEGESTPGVAVGYDLVDVFGVAAGGAGIALVGSGAAAAGVVAVGGANLQFNLFSLSVGKHFGRAQVLAGSYVLDNHHFLPQSAGFATACGAGGMGEAGSGGKVEECASGSTKLDRLPTQFQPFFGIEQRVGKQSSFAGDVLLSSHLSNTVGTTGFRWIAFGRGPFAARIDLALLWSRRGYPLPWVGIGLHFR